MADYLKGAGIATVVALAIGGAILFGTRLNGEAEPRRGEPPPRDSIEPPITDSSADCAQLASEGREGTCELDGVKHSVVTGDSPVRLEDVSVSLRGIRKTRVLRDPVLDESVTADDTFVLMRLKVTNRADRPRTFNQSDQAALLVGDSQYSGADYDVQGPIEPLLIQETIQPGATKTGYIVFDVPRPALTELEKEGGTLAVFSFANAEAGLSEQTPRGDILIEG